MTDSSIAARNSATTVGLALMYELIASRQVSVPFGNSCWFGWMIVAPSPSATWVNGATMTAAWTRPWESAAGICGNGIAIWWMLCGSMPACLASTWTDSEFSEVSWTSATFLPARSLMLVIPEPLAATSTVVSFAGLVGSLPSTVDTHLTPTPLELRLTAPGW